MISKTGVVGAGLMGRDIAGLLANAGYAVTLVDVDDDALDAARHYHERKLPDELQASGYTVSDRPADRITYATEYEGLADAEFVVEAVPERLDLKRDVMASLEAVLDSDVVVGTNTSSLTPGDIAAEMNHRDRVVLFHFANPAIHRDLVEIAGDDATDRALERATEIAEAIDREPIRLRREYRANGLSRLSASIKCAATWELLDADPAAIDVAATRIGFDRGPLELIDLIGLDVHLATIDNLAVTYGDRYEPPAEIREQMDAMVSDGRLGQKSGEGFFEWDGDECLIPEPEDPHDIQPILAALVNEAHRLVTDGIADPETVDEILQRGGDSEIGPFDVEEMFGAEPLREVLERRHDETGAAIYEPVF
ncbi:3-hydroxyacyl-CoA dehydrogenase [Natronomonas salina]|uniref:3-hydroxyacyl-CoA dehydrogenase n=1 Tax=Natronomonas salina TaxID=1710540 RepID=UPI0015B69F3C|nr:3-hydroxyacyl-CoA dehydrogenase [Natronomonas salina]QLD88224.1 3-hydroxyacyl-CoA dehydrogenase [Natronomonas salina]